MNIVTISNQQYVVSKGDRLFIPKQAATIGDLVSLRVLMSVNGDESSIPTQEASIQAKVLAHVKGEKVMVFKKKRRKRYRRTKGHRQQFTQIEIIN